jgi:hypothetical protein
LLAWSPELPGLVVDNYGERFYTANINNIGPNMEIDQHPEVPQGNSPLPTGEAQDGSQWEHDVRARLAGILGRYAQSDCTDADELMAAADHIGLLPGSGDPDSGIAPKCVWIEDLSPDTKSKPLPFTDSRTARLTLAFAMHESDKRTGERRDPMLPLDQTAVDRYRHQRSGS